jgi:hypothetical protein
MRPVGRCRHDAFLKGHRKMNLRQIAGIVLAASTIACFSGGCSTKYIPNTEIEDNAFNREVVEFCERYRRAVEDMNIGLILSFASPRYFDTSGTITGDDDMDRTNLEEVLKDRFKAISSLRFEIRYLDLYERENTVFVEYTYTTSYQFEVAGKVKWANKTADNRLELAIVEGGFLVLSGM